MTAKFMKIGALFIAASATGIPLSLAALTRVMTAKTIIPEPPKSIDKVIDLRS
jgi:hypothetical protein